MEHRKLDTQGNRQDVSVDRRGFLLASVAGAGLTFGCATRQAAAQERKYQDGASPWPLALNTSTIRPASLQDKVRVAAEAGFDAIELWVNDLEELEKSGGDVKALGAEIRDRGLFVPM